MAARALDHIVLPCADLDEAARAFTTLGFRVGRRNRHPWGTENHIVQVPGAFLELVALTPDAAAVLPADDAFPFAGFLAGRGASRDPSGMIVLRSNDAKADADLFAAQGIGAGRTLDFSRSGVASDGATRPVAFSLAFAEAPTMPDLGFFVCQQHFPENFWDPALQDHPNGVTGIAAVSIAAERPGAQAAFLASFVGGEPRQASGGAVSIDLGDGSAIVVEPVATSPRLTALRFRTTRAPREERFGGLRLILAD